jgi:hypothetical protein
VNTIGDILARLPDCRDGRIALSKHHVGPQIDQLLGQGCELRGIASGPTKIDVHIASSVHPSSLSRPTNRRVNRSLSGSPEVSLSTPMRFSSRFCATAASGEDEESAAAPPRSAMNSRRFS